MIQRLVRFWFGDDVFISYSRRDGSRYAVNLGNELVDLKFSCSFDQWGTPPGQEMPESLRKKLSRSSTLVLIGTERAARSNPVWQEIKEFRKTGRPIIPIIFDGVRVRDGISKDGLLAEVSEDTTKQEALWAGEIHGAAITLEKSENLEQHRPSPEVVGRIKDSYRFMRKDQRQRVAGSVLLVVFGILVVAISLAYHRERVQTHKANEMTQRAQAAGEEQAKQQRLAEEATKDAALADSRAEESNNRAEAAKRKADEQTKIAQVAGRRAREATIRADQQESNAQRNLASNFYTQAQVEALNDPRRAIVWASRAVAKAPVDDSLRSIYGLMAAHLASEIPNTIINTPAPIRAAIFCDANDKVAVLARSGDLTLWDLRTGERVGPGLPLAVEAVATGINEPVFSRDGKWIAALVWDMEAMRKVATPHEWHYRLRLWSAETGALQKDIPTTWNGSEAQGLSFSPDGNEVLVFGSDNYSEDDDLRRSDRMRVWDRASGSLLKFSEPFRFGYWQALGNRAFGQRDRIPLSREPSRNWFLNVSRQDKRSLVEIRNIRDGRLVTGFSHQGEIIFADLSPNARKLVTVSSPDQTKAELRIWDIDSGQSTEPKTREVQGEEGTPSLSKSRIPDDIFGIQDISPDGAKLLMEQHGDRSLEIWYSSESGWWVRDLESRLSEEGDLGRYRSGLASGFFTHDGRFVVESLQRSTGFLKSSIELRVWDVKTRRLMAPTRTIPAETVSYYASPSSMMLSVALTDGTLMSSGLMRNGSIVTETRLQLPEDHTLGKVFLTPTGEVLAFSYEPQPESFGPIRMMLLEANSGTQKWAKDVATDPYTMRDVTFSPDGGRFLMSTRETGPAGELRPPPVWWVRRTIDGNVVPGFRGIPGRFLTVQFNRDGTMLVTSEFDAAFGLKIRKWSAASGDPVTSATVKTNATLGEFVKFTRFGDYYVTTSFEDLRKIVVRSVDISRHESAEFRFADTGTSALAAVFFERAREVRFLETGGLHLLMDSGVVISIKPSPQGSEIADARSQLLFPLSTESLGAFGIGLDRIPTAPQIEDVSADGTLLAVRVDDHTLRVWESRTGRPLSELFWHEGQLRLVKFVRNSQLLAITDTGEERSWYVGEPNRKVPTWMTSLGEALSGMKLVNEIELQPIPQVEYVGFRRRYLETLRKAAAFGDRDALVILSNWHP